MKNIIAAIALTIVSSSAFAFEPFNSNSIKSTYDHKSGNTYNTRRIGNTTRQTGYNLNNGTNWNSSTTGSRTTGQDSNGNNYTYDANTGNYHNYGTGKSCYGKGQFRTCN